MTTWRAVLDTLLARPRVVRIEPAHSQRLPGGRTLIEVEVSGWGLLHVRQALIRPYWCGCVMRLLVPLGTPFRIEVWGWTGRIRHECGITATLEQAPESAPAPNVKLAAIGRPLGTDLVRELGTRIPVSFVMPGPVLRFIGPRLRAVPPLVSKGLLLPRVPRPIEAVQVEVQMPPVRRKQLSPPPSPSDASVLGTH